MPHHDHTHDQEHGHPHAEISQTERAGYFERHDGGESHDALVCF